jgi:hypothetical protein
VHATTTGTEPPVARGTWFRHRHAFWAAGIVMLAAAAVQSMPLLYGLPLGEGTLRDATILSAVAAALMIGGTGYARQKEWGRRVVDAALWAIVFLLSAYLGVLARRHSYVDTLGCAVGLFVAVSFRSEIWESDVGRASGRAASASHSRGIELRRRTLRTLGFSMAVAAVAALVSR